MIIPASASRLNFFNLSVAWVECWPKEIVVESALVQPFSYVLHAIVSKDSIGQLKEEDNLYRC